MILLGYQMIIHSLRVIKVVVLLALFPLRFLFGSPDEDAEGNTLRWRIYPEPRYYWWRRNKGHRIVVFRDSFTLGGKKRGEGTWRNQPDITTRKCNPALLGDEGTG